MKVTRPVIWVPTWLTMAQLFMEQAMIINHGSARTGIVLQ